MTTVVTTASPLVLDRADEVVVLVDGRAASVGTHAELLRGDPYYRGLVSRAQDDIETGWPMSRQMPVAGPAEVRAAAIRDLGADRRAVIGVVLVNGLAAAAV